MVKIIHNPSSAFGLVVNFSKGLHQGRIGTFQAMDVGCSQLPIYRTQGRSRPFRHQLFQFLDWLDKMGCFDVFKVSECFRAIQSESNWNLEVSWNGDTTKSSVIIRWKDWDLPFPSSDQGVPPFAVRASSMGEAGLEAASMSWAVKTSGLRWESHL